MNTEFLTDLNGNPTTTFVLSFDSALEGEDAIIGAANDLRAKIRQVLMGIGLNPSAKVVGEGDVWLHTIATSDAVNVVFEHDEEALEKFVRIALIPTYSDNSINQQIAAFGYELSEDQHKQFFTTLETLHKGVFDPEFQRVFLQLQEKFKLLMTIE
jgi:hypothetical protein